MIISKPESLTQITKVATVPSVHKESSGTGCHLEQVPVEDPPEGPEGLENPVASSGTDSAPGDVSSKTTVMLDTSAFAGPE